LLGSCAPGPSASYAWRSLGTFEIGEDGLSEPIEIEVPEGARSLQLLVLGAPASTYALGSFVTPDGVEHSELAASPDPQAQLREALIPPDDFAPLYVGLQHFATAESFVHVHPNDGTPVRPGLHRVRVLSSASRERVEVRVITPPDDGADVIHINLHDVAMDVPEARIRELAAGVTAIFAEAGLRVVVDEIVEHRPTSLRDLFCASPPCTTVRPGSRYTELVRVGRPLSASDALDVYVVDLDPTGGVSLGQPGANAPDSELFGVFIHAANANDDDVGPQTIAHEIAHFLGLWHVSETYPDPIADTDDTNATCTNLMSYCGVETGLTPGQVRVIRASPLVRPG